MNTWLHGRWQRATQKYSPNYEPRPNKNDISLIVLHNISLAPFEYGSDAVECLFTNTIDANANPFFTQLVDFRVSSHFFYSAHGRNSTICFV